MTAEPPAGRRRYAVAILVAGAVAMVAGAMRSFVAAVAAARSSMSSGALPVLPVHVYRQYTQSGLGPDYTQVWIGLGIAIVGLLAVVAGCVVALVRRSA